MCAAPVGNQFWKARSSHGRNPIFASPEDLRDACEQYFEWAASNPLLEEKVFNGKDGIVRADVAKMRAMTIGGLCIFLDIDRTTWLDYGRKEDFSKVVTRVEETIRDQKFSGAAADLLNANIIARDLGMADKSEVTGKDGGPIETKDTSDLEVARRVAFLLSRASKPDA